MFAPNYQRYSQFKIAQYIPFGDKAAELEEIRRHVERDLYEKELGLPTDFTLFEWMKGEVTKLRKPFFQVNMKELQLNPKVI